MNMMESVSPVCASSPTLTIIVKALNEEKRIAACLKSALAELEGLDGEVILVDSLSADRTVDIALELGVKVVQFESVADRNCGAALQLGYQYARGEYIYLLDGDMTLEPGFIRHALAYLQAHQDVAGVGGKLIDRQVMNVADKLRVAHYEALTAPCEVNVLGGGGLYRTAAIRQVGYLANRWLRAFEEAELGVRLRSAGWRLLRLPVAGVLHSGHDETSLQLLLRLWRIGRIEAGGIFVRTALGHPWQWRVVRTCWYLFIAPLIYLAALLAATVLAHTGLAFHTAVALTLAGSWCTVFGVLAARKRNLHDAAIAVLSWHMYAVGGLAGFLKPAGDPAAWIAGHVLGEQRRPD